MRQATETVARATTNWKTGWKVRLDKVELNIRASSKDKWIKSEGSIIQDLESRTQCRAKPHRKSTDKLFRRATIISNGSVRLQIFHDRVWERDYFKPLCARIIHTCEDSVSYELHHELLLAVQQQLEDKGIYYTLAKAEICMDTPDHDQYIQFVQYMVPRWMNLNKFHYWDEDKGEEAAGPNLQGAYGYFNFRNQSRQIHWYKKSTCQGDLYRVELRLNHRFLSGKRIRTPAKLLDSRCQLLRSSITLRRFNLSKLLNIKRRLVRRGACAEFTAHLDEELKRAISACTTFELLPLFPFLLEHYCSRRYVQSGLTDFLPYPELGLE
ncbi:MAG: hypothetical protein AB1473_13135 [Thermodesulfobacteriota bacterium]